jgi:hypothetical protein
MAGVNFVNLGPEVSVSGLIVSVSWVGLMVITSVGQRDRIQTPGGCCSPGDRRTRRGTPNHLEHNTIVRRDVLGGLDP